MKRVIILGAPRSGTTWLGEIFNSHPAVAYRYQPLHAWSFPTTIAEACQQDDINQFFADLLNTEDDYVTHLRSSAFGASLPNFEKCTPSHLVFKETHFPATCDRIVRESDDVMLIGLIRDPVDSLTSWWNVANEFQGDWAIGDEWLGAPSKNRGRAGHVAGFSGWMTVTRTLLKLCADEP